MNDVIQFPSKPPAKEGLPPVFSSAGYDDGRQFEVSAFPDGAIEISVNGYARRMSALEWFKLAGPIS